jgi:hypothetical protein
MDINKEISDFLRDAQYKLALMTAEMDSKEDDGDPYYMSLKMDRWELDYFYTILYETTMAMAGAYNWLSTAEWTEKDILNEIHHLRNKYEMNGLPVLDYATITNEIINFVDEGGGGSTVPPPIGDGDILIGTPGGWVVGSLSEYAGMVDTESLNTYFTERI